MKCKNAVTHSGEMDFPSGLRIYIMKENRQSEPYDRGSTATLNSIFPIKTQNIKSATIYFELKT